METALGRIIAGALVLTDKVMSFFVTAEWTGGGFNPAANDCGLSAYTATLTGCGEYVAYQMASLIASLVSLGGNLLPALGVA